ncbi:unnamed protein product [Caenorhabditis sp. 36 PRJEB53466]|nr:unnamed protein product [Caenorhabditis sp. 36 PRJEB53466]
MNQTKLSEEPEVAQKEVLRQELEKTNEELAWKKMELEVMRGKLRGKSRSLQELYEKNEAENKIMEREIETMARTGARMQTNMDEYNEIQQDWAEQCKKESLRLGEQVNRLMEGKEPPMTLMPGCGFCATEFCASEEKTPRLLGCGHSVCEECARSISEGQDRISCPFCKIVTEVPDSDVMNLKKNFTIVNMFTRI